MRIQRTPEEKAQHAAEVLRRRRLPKSAETRKKISEANTAFWALARKTLAEQEQNGAGALPLGGLPFSDA